MPLKNVGYRAPSGSPPLLGPLPSWSGGEPSGGEPFEGGQSAAPRPTQPSSTIDARLLNAGVPARLGAHLAQGHLEAPGSRDPGWL